MVFLGFCSVGPTQLIAIKKGCSIKNEGEKFIDLYFDVVEK